MRPGQKPKQRSSPEKLLRKSRSQLIRCFWSSKSCDHLPRKETPKNSSNSGLPPSRNNGSNGNRKKSSGDRADLGQAASNVQHTETSETTTPETCSKCDEDLAGVKVIGTDERQKIDIFYEVVTHTVIAEVKVCPNCGKSNKGSFPEGMDGKVQYGDTVKAMVINFMCVQMMSLQRLQEHMMSIIGRSLSQAIMLKYLLQFSVSLKKWEEEQITALYNCKFIHCDETSVRINKINWWVHSYSSSDITLKLVHRHRGREAIDEIGIIPNYTGTLIHDCWASYLSYDNSGHALCGAHLLRELKYTEEAYGYA
jgi:transposase